jgi:hypothetical protein
MPSASPPRHVAHAAIMPVHLYGEPADMEAIMALADKHGLKVVEDVAQAQGAKVRGRRAGALGHAGAHSFFPTKNFGAFGDGGAVTTDDARLAERLRVLRNYGSRVKYVNLERGYNSRLDEMQAAFLRAKLPRLDAWNERRRVLAARYDDKLAGIAGLGLPRTPQWAEPIWHLYVVRTERRADLMEALERAGIGSLIHYPIPPPAGGICRSRLAGGVPAGEARGPSQSADGGTCREAVDGVAACLGNVRATGRSAPVVMDALIVPIVVPAQVHVGLLVAGLVVAVVGAGWCETSPRRAVEVVGPDSRYCDAVIGRSPSRRRRRQPAPQG